MIREIKTYPNKVLKQKAKKVGALDAEIKKLIDDMVETMLAKDGAGLAANQVGELKQVAVVNTVEGAVVLINPKVIEKKGKVVAAEGCLSLPGVELDIKRPQKIVVEYLDESGREKKLRASDLLARVICHEVDHLKGKTILDKLLLIKRFIAKRKFGKNNNK